LKNYAQNLGLCRKAGKLEIGFDAASAVVKRGKAAGILTACDVSAKTLKEIKFHAGKFKTEVISMPCTMAEVGDIIGISAGVMAVTDEGLFSLFK
jgi:ribosomal protein L30E